MCISYKISYLIISIYNKIYYYLKYNKIKFKIYLVWIPLLLSFCDADFKILLSYFLIKNQCLVCKRSSIYCYCVKVKNFKINFSPSVEDKRLLFCYYLVSHSYLQLVAICWANTNSFFCLFTCLND